MSRTSFPSSFQNFVYNNGQRIEPLEMQGDARPSNISIYSEKSAHLICNNYACAESEDINAKTLYHTILKVHQFFMDEFTLNGIDNQGSIPALSIDWDENNAAWSCSISTEGRQCSWIFNNEYVNQPEVVAHEYTHAIISSLAPLNSSNESGALNESLADIFGIAFKHWLTGDVNNWTIGNRNLSVQPESKRVALQAPSEKNDYGYIHENSVIPSFAYYKSVKALSYGYSNVITRIWFKALLQMNPNENFLSFAQKTVNIARRYLPANFANNIYNTNLAEIIKKSWSYVGIKIL